MIGPDEYHDHVDNNTFTNRMAQWRLQTAVDLLNWLRANYPEKAQQLTDQLQLTNDLLTHWQRLSFKFFLRGERQTVDIRK